MNPVAASGPYPDQQAEATLFSRMARGDELALGELYDQWEPRVRATALGIVGDAMEADDVVEETFWQAWRQADRFDPARGSAGAFLLTVARSRAFDRRRAMQRGRDDQTIDATESSQDALALISDDNPHRDAEQREVSRVVRAELAVLPVEQRSVLELAYFEGLSQSEIAERTGEPLGTIKTRMRLATQKLRTRLAQLEEDTR
jgi:RNA polymerase sigma-70 factor (ECF subfamily)